MKSKLLTLLLKGITLGFMVLFLLSVLAVADEDNSQAKKGHACKDVVARISFLKGDIVVNRKGENNWKKAELNQHLCAGDKIRVGKDSKAMFIFPDDRSIQLNQETTLTLSGIGDNEFLLIEALGLRPKTVTSQSEIEPEPPPASDKWRLKSGG